MLSYINGWTEDWFCMLSQLKYPFSSRAQGLDCFSGQKWNSSVWWWGEISQTYYHKATLPHKSSFILISEKLGQSSYVQAHYQLWKSVTVLKFRAHVWIWVYFSVVISWTPILNGACFAYLWQQIVPRGETNRVTRHLWKHSLLQVTGSLSITCLP